MDSTLHNMRLILRLVASMARPSVVRALNWVQNQPSAACTGLRGLHLLRDLRIENAEDRKRLVQIIEQLFVLGASRFQELIMMYVY